MPASKSAKTIPENASGDMFNIQRPHLYLAIVRGGVLDLSRRVDFTERLSGGANDPRVARDFRQMIINCKTLNHTALPG
jgi:hypothetical protein